MESPSKSYDVIIIGGGPAGMSAAIWCADLGLKPSLIERGEMLGGQLLWTHNPITNYLGAEAENGHELAAKFADQVEGASIETIAGQELGAVDLAAHSVAIGAEALTAKAIVIATGVRRRKLGVNGEDEFAGRGIMVSGARDREAARDKKIVIVGGGDAALENALMLSEVAREVIVVHRRGEFTARPEFVEAARQQRNVAFALDSVVTEILGSERVDSVRIKRDSSGITNLVCEAVLIRIGVEPSTELFVGQVELDDRGYVVVDKELRASVAGVWAVGDVTGTQAMTIANAVGAGSVAAKSIASIR